MWGEDKGFYPFLKIDLPKLVFIFNLAFFEPMQNDQLSVSISLKGAELTSIKSCKTGYEFLWQANPAVWARHAPVLFPIVGKVKNDTLIIDGKTYLMKQHGFARDSQFELLNETNTSVIYKLEQTADSLINFPFHFELLLGYELVNNTLICSYTVKNTQPTPIYFSIGAHPGFNLPTKKLNDYEIVFENIEQNHRHLLTNGVFNGTTKPFLTTPNSVKLDANLFDDDAIVIKNSQSKNLTLRAVNGSFSIDMQFDQFPDLGIWTQKGCEEYICLEPWFGHADGVDGHFDISKKEEIITLQPAQVFEQTYSLTFTE